MTASSEPADSEPASSEPAGSDTGDAAARGSDGDGVSNGHVPHARRSSDGPASWLERWRCYWRVLA